VIDIQLKERIRMADAKQIEGAEGENYLWVDGVFLVLFIADWGFLLFLLFSVPEPITGGYGLGGAYVWGPITGIALLPVTVMYVFFQGWILYRKFKQGYCSYQSRLRRATLIAFALTFLFNYITISIMNPS
jgi:hypothetical protein